jgi:hypothetical protein
VFWTGSRASRASGSRTRTWTVASPGTRRWSAAASAAPGKRWSLLLSREPGGPGGAAVRLLPVVQPSTTRDPRRTAAPALMR